MALTLAFSSFLSCCTTCSSLSLRVFPGGSAKKFECSSSRFVMSAHNMASNPRKVNTDIRSTLPLEKIEIFKSLETMALAEESMLSMLKPVEESWQPQDFLPDSTSEEFIDVIKELKERTKEIPDEYLICLVGNMITEEALPTYQTIINTADGFRDETGSSLTPWARWMRMWTAEENRHGDLLNKYLYLSGRCDMRQIEKTIQYLLGAGMDIGMDNSPYQGAIYSSFQERATFITHGNTARNAKKYGDTTLAKICGAIAADEKRHEMAYTKLAEMLFRIDPDTMMQAFATMMKKRITMPSLLMFDGHDCNLFNHFAAVSNRLGVYTTRDYADMVEFFVKRWKVEELTELSPQGMQAQEYVCGLAQRFRKLEEKAQDRIKPKKSSNMVPFSWIFNKPVMLL